MSMKKIFWPLLFIGAVAFGLLLNYSLAVVVAGLVLLLILLISQHLDWGAYAMVVTGFLTGLEIDFSRYPWARDIPYLPGINAPLIDFVALGVLAGLLTVWMTGEWSKLKKISLPGWHWYALFLLASLVSAWLAPASDHDAAFKAWVRPQVFVFAGFFVTFIAVVRERVVLEKVLQTWFGVGLATAVFAVASLLISVGNAVWRATPFAIFGYAPFGYNHNLLAEALAVTLPVALYFFVSSKVKETKFFAGFTSIFIGLMALLTLSRAAWLAVAVVVIIFTHYFKIKTSAQQNLLPRLSRVPLYLAALLVPAIAYMGLFLTSSTVTSSTAARWEVTKIVLWNLQRAPLWGYGPGQFISLLADNTIYVLEFGDPLDAHGFIQKIVLENGLIGLVLFGLFLRAQIQSAGKKLASAPREVKFLAQSLVASGIVFQLFNTSYYHAVFWLPLALAAVLASVSLEKN